MIFIIIGTTICSFAVFMSVLIYVLSKENDADKYDFYMVMLGVVLTICFWIGTEKIDGTNIRIYWNGYEFEIAGRTSKSDVPKEIQEIFKKKFDSDMEVIFEQKFGKKDVILFCEGYGGKVQNGAYDCETSLIGFDVMVNDMYLDKFEAKSIFEELGIDFVPMTIFANLGEAIKYVQEHSQSIKHPTCALEGLVCVPAVRIYDVNGKRVIVKIKGRELKKVKE